MSAVRTCWRQMLRIAAPVGVTRSPASPSSTNSRPCSSKRAAAGVGTGSQPCVGLDPSATPSGRALTLPRRAGQRSRSGRLRPPCRQSNPSHPARGSSRPPRTCRGLCPPPPRAAQKIAMRVLGHRRLAGRSPAGARGSRETASRRAHDSRGATQIAPAGFALGRHVRLFHQETHAGEHMVAMLHHARSMPPAGNPAARIAASIASRRSGKRIQHGGDEHIARHAADRVEVEVHGMRDERALAGSRAGAKE